MSVRNVYLDCEFLPADPTTRGLVSIGMTDNHGSNFYAVNADMDQRALLAVPWMVNNVWPYLPTVADDGVPGGRELDYDDAQVIGIDEIRAGVAAYFNQTRASETRLYAYYGGQDIGRLHSLWDNNWEAMPDQIPQWFTELEGLIVDAGRPRLPAQDGGEHHALADARYNRQIHEALLARQSGDTMAAWLYQRFSSHSITPWTELSADDQAYWEHQADAVRRATARGGFKVAGVA